MSRPPSRLAAFALVVSFLVTASVVGGAARAATAATNPWEPNYPKSVPHPNFPNTVKLWLDSSGKTWNTPSGAVESNRLKLLAAKALDQAQSVPSSFWQRQVQAVKNGTSSFPGTAKVMEQGNLTKYRPTSILVDEGKFPGNPGAGKVARTSIPATNASKLMKGNAAMVGLAFGLAVGNIGARAFGFKDDMLCQEGNDGLKAVGAILNGADCSGYDNALAEADRNLEQPAKMLQTSTCVSGFTGCAMLQGTTVAQTGGSGGWMAACFAGTGLGDGVYQVMVTWAGGFQSSGLEGGGSLAYACQAAAMGTDFSAIPQSRFTTPQVTSWYLRKQVTATTWTDGPKVTLTPADYQKANPPRAFECKIIAQTGEGYVKSSQPFRQGDEVLSNVMCPDLPPGKKVGRVEIKQKTPDGSAPDQVVYDQPVTPEYLDLQTKYPECATGNCLLDLRVAGASCFEGETDCAEWFTDPDKATKYSCKFGTHAVELKECNVYAQLFKQDAATGGKPWADPEDGSVPGGAMSGPVPTPLMDREVMGTEEPRECFPSGWSAFNPVNWVLQPVQCALEWAFVPRQVVVETKSMQAMNSWRDTAPGAVLDTIANWDVKFHVNGCDGLMTPWTYTAAGGSATTPIGIPSACPGTPLADFAGWVRLIGGLVMIVASAIAIRKHAGASIGYNT